jgi:hypothetical protein
MRPVSFTRTTIGIMIISGLLWCRPLIWVCGIMMVFAGLTGVCFLDVFYRLILPKRSPPGEAADGFEGPCA